MMKCRSCGHEIERPFMDFGELPLPNTFVDPDQTEKIVRYPMALYHCSECQLVQLKNLIPPNEIFNDHYKYFSSYSKELLEQSQLITEKLINQYQLTTDAHIVEVASNDGYLLNFFKKAGYENILGIEPTLSTAMKAIEKGIPTEICFFNEETARRLAKSSKADVLIANNVIAHVPDINDFVRGIDTLIQDDAIVVIEFQYLLDLLRNRYFDLMYHEHYSYFSLHSVISLIERNGLTITQVEKTCSQGGSLRIYCRKSNYAGAISQSVSDLLEEEKEFGLDRENTYTEFSDAVYKIRKKCLIELDEMMKKGMKIAAYGASAKGSIFINYLGLQKNIIQYIVDKNEHKQGLLLAGTNIPVCTPSQMRIEPVDRVLILSWNLKEEIQTEYPDIDFFVMMPPS